MTDREILKEIVEIQKELVTNIMILAPLDAQNTYYSGVAVRINNLLEKLTKEEPV